MLVAYCGATQSLFAHAVPRKGADHDGYIVEQPRQDVFWLGHAQVTIKGDNEPSLVQVVDKTLAALKMSGVSNACGEGSVPYDPQTSGAAEKAVRLLKGSIKTILLGLERQIHAKVPIDHPIMGWLVSHAAHVNHAVARP